MPRYFVKYRGIPRHGLGLLLLTVLLSLLLHMVSFWRFEQIAQFWEGKEKEAKHAEKRTIQVKLTREKKRPQDEENKKIVEAKQQPTESPDNPRYWGYQDHKALKETKANKQVNHSKAQDAGESIQRKSQSSTPNKPQEKTDKQQKKQRKELDLSPDGLVIQNLRKPRNKYEEFIPNSIELSRAMVEGYKDYIDDEIAEGDKIDINTADYRFIGYFTALRKAFELVWIYPMEARRQGMQGVVDAEFVISKDGSLKTIKVIRSSGYRVLDDAVVDALRLAAPFSPLPSGIGREKILVSGSFRYVLGG